MGINAITSTRAAIATDLISAIAQRATKFDARETNARKTVRRGADDAFRLGGSRSDNSSGFYSVLGSLLSAMQRETGTELAKVVSPEEKLRVQRLQSASARLKAGDTEGARRITGDLLKRNSSDVSALSIVGESHLADRDYKKAEKVFARAVSIAPKDARLSGGLADARLLMRSDGEVLASVRGKLTTPSERSTVQRLLLRLSDRSPRNTDVYLSLADSYRAGHDSTKTLGALQEAVKHADEKQVDGVISRTRQFLTDNPQTGLAHNILGRALQKAGRREEAITELKAATAVAPNDFAFRSDLATGYADRALGKLGRGNLGGAKVDLTAGQAIDPGNTALREASARVAERDARTDVNGGRYKAALSKLFTAASKAPDDIDFKKSVASLYSRVGVYYQTGGGDAQALTSFMKAYELDPSSNVARRKVGELSHSQGLKALARKDYDNAVRHLDRAYGTYRPDETYGADLARAYDERGQFREALGKLSDAIDDYKEGYSIDPSNASLALNLSNALILNASS